MLELTELEDGFAVGILSHENVDVLNELTRDCVAAEREDGYRVSGLCSQQPRFDGDQWHHIVVFSKRADSSFIMLSERDKK